MRRLDKQILNIALPSIISNITVPLLGMVDVAIVGHLGSATYIGAISVGSMIFNVTYWLFGFLRMGTSGLTSQALGRRDLGEVMVMFLRSTLIGLSIALLLVLLQYPLREFALWLVAPTAEVGKLTRTYFNICIWGAPATLTLYCLSGWYIGMQNTRIPMLVSIFQNVVNIVASLFFVFVLGMKVEGVALGTVIAQYSGILLSLLLWWVHYRRLRRHGHRSELLNTIQLKRFFRLNTDIFFRTLCLVAVMLFFTSAGARQGDIILAVNTLLMQFYLLFSYFMDGFAFAGEAICGKHFGSGNRSAYRITVKRVFVWALGCSLLFTLLYTFGGPAYVRLLTDEGEVIAASRPFLPWVIALPLMGFVAFIWDGIFIGSTASRQMLVSSFIASCLFFALFFCFRRMLGNHGLWLAYTCYLFSRGLVQTYQYHHGLKDLRS